MSLPVLAPVAPSSDANNDSIVTRIGGGNVSVQFEMLGCFAMAGGWAVLAPAAKSGPRWCTPAPSNLSLQPTQRQPPWCGRMTNGDVRNVKE